MVLLLLDPVTQPLCKSKHMFSNSSGYFFSSSSPSPSDFLKNPLYLKSELGFFVSFPDSSVSSCIATVLKVRRQEYEQLEEQKKQRCSFLHLCSSIEGVIRGTIHSI